MVSGSLARSPAIRADRFDNSSCSTRQRFRSSASCRADATSPPTASKAPACALHRCTAASTPRRGGVTLDGEASAARVSHCSATIPASGSEVRADRISDCPATTSAGVPTSPGRDPTRRADEPPGSRTSADPPREPALISSSDKSRSGWSSSTTGGRDPSVSASRRSSDSTAASWSSAADAAKSSRSAARSVSASSVRIRSAAAQAVPASSALGGCSRRAARAVAAFVAAEVR